VIDREKIVSVFDDLRQFADTDIHPIVSPDNWIAYSDLCDMIDDGEETLIALLKEHEAEQKTVILCKDCKWYKDGKWFTQCNGSNRVFGFIRPDWFCADGERKEKND